MIPQFFGIKNVPNPKETCHPAGLLCLTNLVFVARGRQEVPLDHTDNVS